MGGCARVSGAMIFYVLLMAGLNACGLSSPAGYSGGSLNGGAAVGGIGPGQALPATGDFGATQGGVQDMGLARELVLNGRVPPAEAFVVEGMFSEHELGLEGTPCEELLCLQAATGVWPALNGAESGWIQVGMSSTIDPNQYLRPTTTLIATVDTSGSMGWFYATDENEYIAPGSIARALLERVAEQLGPQDRLAIVTYGSFVNTLLPVTRADDRTRIDAAINLLSAEGSTDMESGLRRAYELAHQADDGETEQVRIMLFTDVQPNVGATTPTEFERMVAEGTESDVGLTVMGVGVGLGQAVLNAMTHMHGGNAFSLFDLEDVAELMDNDWPFLVSPIAYDLRVEVDPSDFLAIGETFGFPDGDAGTGPSIDVSTVFLSKRKGALLLQLLPRVDLLALGSLESLDQLSTPAATGLISYLTPKGRVVEQRLELGYKFELADEAGHYFEQPSVAKTVALALLVSAMKEAAAQYANFPDEVYDDYIEDAYGDWIGFGPVIGSPVEPDIEGAADILQRAIDHVSAIAENLRDEMLDAELEFANKLLELIKAGAPQGDLYGQI